jgi:hypothetical protein
MMTARPRVWLSVLPIAAVFALTHANAATLHVGGVSCDITPDMPCGDRLPIAGELVRPLRSGTSQGRRETVSNRPIVVPTARSSAEAELRGKRQQHARP